MGFALMLLLTGLNFLFLKLIVKRSGKVRAVLLAVCTAIDVAALAAYFAVLITKSMPSAYLRTFCIGFLVLRMIGTAVETYRGEGSEAPRFGNFLLYSSLFFLIQRGPVVSFSEVSPMLKSREVSSDGISEGISLFVRGLAMKAIVSNTILTAAHKLLSLDGSDINILTGWLGSVLFALQLYFDIAGYSNIAVGIGRMFGFELPDNFRQPFAASGVIDLLSRWHITLTEWFRKNVYAPIGGSGKSVLRSIAACVLVCLLASSWHYPSVSFLISGALFALFLAIDILIKRSGAKPLKPVLIILTLFAFVIAIMPLYTKEAAAALKVCKAMFTGFYVSRNSLAKLSVIMKPNAVAASVAGVLLASPLPGAIAKRIPRKPVFRAAGYFLTFVLFIVCAVFIITVEQQPGFFESL